MATAAEQQAYREEHEAKMTAYRAEVDARLASGTDPLVVALEALDEALEHAYADALQIEGEWGISSDLGHGVFENVDRLQVVRDALSRNEAES